MWTDSPWRSVGVTIALLVCTARIVFSDKHHPDVSLLGLLTILAALRVVSVDDVFSGFSSPSVATMLVSSCLAHIISASASTSTMLRAILGDPSNTPAAQVRLMLLVMLTSAFVDDAALVALLVPLVTRWAAQHGFPPGQLLLPLSYAALLGGNLTLVGNPVNLLLAGLANEHLVTNHQPPLHILDIGRLGLPLALWGCFCMVLVAPLLLPGYDTPQGGPSGGPGREQFMLGLRVGPSSHRVKGSTIQGAGLRHLKGVYLVALRRGADVVHAVDPTMQLEERDVLYFTGQTEYVQALAKDYQLEFVSEALEGGNVQGTLMGVPGPRRPRRPSPFAAAAAAAGVDQPTQPDLKEQAAAIHQDGILLRMTIRPDAPIVGTTVKDVDMLRRYHAVLLGVSKGGRLLGWPLGDVKYEAGDRLLCSVGQEWWQRCARDVQGTFRDVRPVGQQDRVCTFTLVYKQPNLPGLRARDIIAPLHYVSLTGITTASGNTVHNTLTHVVMDGDQLHLTGTVEGLLAAQKVSHTALTAVNTGVTRSTGVEQHLVQVVLSAKGGLLGMTVRDARFRTAFHAAIIAVYRGGHQLQGRIGDIVLAAGDTLLLDSTPAFIQRFGRDPRFALVSKVAEQGGGETQGGNVVGHNGNKEGSNTDGVGKNSSNGKQQGKQRVPARGWRCITATIRPLLPLLVTSAALCVHAFGAVDLLVAQCVALGVVLMWGDVQVESLTRSVRLEGVLVMAAALGMSKALQASGLPQVLTWTLSGVFSPGLTGNTLLLIVVYSITVLLSQVISSPAVVSFMFPIASQLGQQQGVPMNLIAKTLMLAGSAVYTSPLLYETNVIVLGAGGYRTADVLRFGAVLQLWQALGAITLLTWHQYWPVFWGLVAQASVVVLLGAPALAGYLGFGEWWGGVGDADANKKHR